MVPDIRLFLIFRIGRCCVSTGRAPIAAPGDTIVFLRIFPRLFGRPLCCGKRFTRKVYIRAEPIDPAHFLAQELFDLNDDLSIIAACKGISLSGAGGAAGAADPVGKSIHRIRHIKIDHMRNAGHINTARCNIRSHQDLEFTALETVQGFLSLLLRKVAL